MKREAGYYWVKRKGDWIIAYYTEYGKIQEWRFEWNHELRYGVDKDFQKIDERRITRPEEPFYKVYRVFYKSEHYSEGYVDYECETPSAAKMLFENDDEICLSKKITSIKYIG